jgi:hypothetical protein
MTLSFISRPLYARGATLGMQWVEGKIGPRTFLDDLQEKQSLFSSRIRKVLPQYSFKYNQQYATL